MKEMVDAKKVRYGADDLAEVLNGVKRVVAAKGKKVTTFDLSQDVDDAELHKHLLGPTGNLRAPTFRRGKKLFVGFHPDELAIFMS